MSLSLRSVLPQNVTSLRALETVTEIHDPSFRRQASRILINRHHQRLGGLTGPIGFPLGDLRPTGDGGFTKPYSGGLIELLDLVNGPQGFQTFRAEVKFVGYRVVNTNDISADQPYFIIGVAGTNPERAVTVRTNIIPDFDVKSGHNVVLQQTITTDAQPPVVLSVTGMDHDKGDPDEAAAKVTKFLNDTSAKLTLALPLLGVSPDVGAYIQSVLNIFGGTAGDIISGLFGMGDDLVGQNARTFFDLDADTPEWRTPKARTHADFDQPHNVEISLDNGEGGGYIAFFNVQLFKDTRIPVAPLP